MLIQISIEALERFKANQRRNEPAKVEVAQRDWDERRVASSEKGRGCSVRRVSGTRFDDLHICTAARPNIAWTEINFAVCLASEFLSGFDIRTCVHAGQGYRILTQISRIYVSSRNISNVYARVRRYGKVR